MRNKPSKKKTLFGFLWNIFEHENIEIIILGLLGLIISIFGHAIYANHSQIQSEFDTLAINVRDLADVDEYLYDDCNNLRDRNEILSDVNSLREKFKTLVDQHATMGNALSLKTYCTIHEFTAWNDQLQDAGENVCNINLKSEVEIDQWRDKILNQIYSNKEARRGPVSSIKEYFTDFQKNPHVPEQCEQNPSQTLTP